MARRDQVGWCARIAVAGLVLVTASCASLGAAGNAPVAAPDVVNHAAIPLGDVTRLERCIAEDASVAAAYSADGFTALHFAAYLGGAASVRALLAAGSDCSAVARNDMRVQPLHSAVALGDLEACRALLDAGADPNAEQQGGFRPLDEALITENAPVAALLRERGAQASGNPLKQ